MRRGKLARSDDEPVLAARWQLLSLLSASWPRILPYRQPTAMTTSLQENAFLSKLWSILEDPENRHIVSWDDAGANFHVYLSKALETSILPKYFRHGKFSSFQRQLNYFGFKKIGKGDHGGSVYHHPMFQRNKPEDCLKIKRKTNRKKKSSQVGDLENFLGDMDMNFEDMDLEGGDDIERELLHSGKAGQVCLSVRPCIAIRDASNNVLARCCITVD